MANNTRGEAKRKLKLAKGNIDQALIHLKFIHDRYETRPQVQEPTEAFIVLFLEVQTGLDRLEHSF